MSNLPAWKGADVVYSRAYRVLEAMAADGHAKPASGANHRRNGSVSYILPGHTSQAMDDLIEALNGGNEELIKGLLLESLRYFQSSSFLLSNPIPTQEGR